jgi:hypothetical protein
MARGVVRSPLPIIVRYGTIWRPEQTITISGWGGMRRSISSVPGSVITACAVGRTPTASNDVGNNARGQHPCQSLRSYDTRCPSHSNVE